MSTAPEASVTSFATVAEYLVLAAGLAGIAVSVLTLTSVPLGKTFKLSAKQIVVNSTVIAQHAILIFVIGELSRALDVSRRVLVVLSPAQVPTCACGIRILRDVRSLSAGTNHHV